MPDPLRELIEAMRDAVSAAEYVVRLVEKCGNAGVSPNPFEKSDWQETALNCYGAMNWVSRGRRALAALEAAPVPDVEATDILDSLLMQGLRDVVPGGGWVSVPEVEWDSAVEQFRAVLSALQPAGDHFPDTGKMVGPPAPRWDGTERRKGERRKFDRFEAGRKARQPYHPSALYNGIPPSACCRRTGSDRRAAKECCCGPEESCSMCRPIRLAPEEARP